MELAPWLMKKQHAFQILKFSATNLLIEKLHKQLNITFVEHLLPSMCFYMHCTWSLSHAQLCDPKDCSRQAPLSMGILQARILEWVATSSSRGSSQPSDQTQFSHIAGIGFTIGERNGNPLQYSCWRIPGTEEPGGLPSVGSHRVRHDWSDLAAAAAAAALSSEPPGKPKNTGVGSLSLLHGILMTQELKWGLLHCRWILYQLTCQGSPYTL